MYAYFNTTDTNERKPLTIMYAYFNTTDTTNKKPLTIIYSYFKPTQPMKEPLIIILTTGCFNWHTITGKSP